MYSTLAVTIGDVYGGLNGTSIKDRHQGPWFNVQQDGYEQIMREKDGRDAGWGMRSWDEVEP